MAEPLTKRQKEVLDYVTQFIELHGYAPSYREIASARVNCIAFRTILK